MQEYGVRETADPFQILGQEIEGRFRIEGLEGSGGFGVVYRARDLHSGDLFALKILRRPADARSWLEGRLLQRLAPLHGAFVGVFGTGTLLRPQGSFPFLVLEWLDGCTLEAELDRRRRGADERFTLTAVLDLLGHVAEGLAVAHERRVAHRDIKPSNLFLARKSDRVVSRILDFGLAKNMSAAASDSASLLESRFAMTPFTPAYGAPEQWVRRLGATGPWTDVHALALICVELLSGHRALHGETPVELMTACLDGRRRPTPEAFGIHLGPEIDAVFETALALEPRERFRSVGVFWRALTSAASRSTEIETSAVRRWFGHEEREDTSESTTLVSQSSPVSTTPGSSRESLPAPRRWRLASSSLGLGVLLVCASPPFSPPALTDEAGERPGPRQGVEETTGATAPAVQGPPPDARIATQEAIASREAIAPRATPIAARVSDRRRASAPRAAPTDDVSLRSARIAEPATAAPAVASETLDPLHQFLLGNAARARK
jgi:serine/threonine protein kinase